MIVSATKRWRAAMLLPLPRNLLMLFLPWALLICLLSALFYDRILDDRLAPLLDAQSDTLGEGSAVLERHLASLRGDLQFISQQPLLARAIQRHSDDSYAALGELFVEFANSRGVYARIRWLDETGMEQVRVNSLDGRSVLVDGQQLRNDSSDDYFVETMSLFKGEAYLSRFQLSRDHDQIEQPLRPVLQAAMPIFSDRGERRGIIVLDYLGTRLLQRLEETSRAYGSALQLLDHEGYWMLGESQQDAWGYLLGRPDATLASRQPEIWRRLQNSDRDAFLAADGFWGYNHFRPDGFNSAAAFSNRWLLVSHLPGEQIQSLRWGVIWRVAIFLVVMLLLGLWVAVRLARTESGRRRAQHELLVSSHALQRSNQQLQSTVDQLQRTRKALLQAEKLSSLGTLVAGVAHELNTPLGAASVAASTLEKNSESLQGGMREGLKRTMLDRFMLRNDEGLNIILTSLERMAQLTRAFKQLATDRASTERRSFDLAELVDEVVLLLQPKIKQSEHRVVLDVPLGLSLDSYPGPLGQILQNLIDNALIHAFEPGFRGVVTVRVATDGDRQHCLIEVSDNGRGMSEETLAKIFDPFFTTRRGQGGTGLGLHITHQLSVDILGAELDVVSAPGQGSCFSLRMDLG